MNAVTEPSDAEPTAVAASSKKRTMFGGISAKLVALLLVFGLAPAAMLTGILYSQEDGIKAALTSKVASTAVAVNDVIDRNLFERYGDVQAFGLNAAARDPANWGKPGDANPLVGAMNGYMTGYGIYRLMLLLSPEGKVIAANSMRADGKKLATGALYGRSFAEAKWFRRVMEGNFLNGRNGFTGTAVDQPYREKLVADLYGGDGYVIPFSAPVRDAAGRTVAVWVNFADFGLVEEIVATFHAGSTKENMTDTEITILDPEGRVIADYDPVRLGIKSVREYKRNPEVIGKLNLAESGVEAAQRAIRGESGAMVSMHSRKKIVQAAGYAKSIGAYDYPGLGWSTLVRIPDNEAFTLWDNLIAIMLIAVAISAGTIVLAGLFLGNGAARPIRKLSETMMTLAGGDKTVDVPLTGRADEFGDMARTVQVFKDNMIETERLQAEQRAAEKRAQEEELQRTAEKRAAEAKAGEERRAAEEKAEQDRKQALLKMADTFEKSVMGVVKAVASATTEMQSSAQAMSSTAEETSRQATSVASASEEASTNVQTVATAAEELSASVEEIGRQVKQSNEIAQSAVSQAKDTNDKVEGLANAAQKIGEVVNLINDIASQTNLLALNATIEAARAGDAGKGFAVVASEVKSLANQTAKATEDIAGQITAIQGATAEAVQAIQTIGRTIGEIGEIATTVAAAVDQQGSATREIAGSVQQAAIGTQEVSSNIVQVTQAATESQAASSQMLSAAQELAQQGEVLRGEVEKFLETVRAA